MRREGDGPHGALVHAARLAAAQVADVDDVVIDLDGADGTAALALAAQHAQGGRGDDLPQRSERQGGLGALEAVALPAEPADEGEIDAQRLDFNHLDSRRAAPYSPGAKKGAGDLAALAPGTLGRVDPDHDPASLSMR